MAQKIAELAFNLETGQMTAGLQKLSNDTAKTMGNIVNSASQVSTKFSSEFSKAFTSSEQLKKGINGVSDSIKNMVSQFAGLAIISTALVPATKATMQLHDAMIDISKLGDFTPEGLEQLKNDIKDLAQEIPLTTAELAKIGESGVQAGLPTGELKEFIELTGKASSALGLIPDETADNLGKISSAFGGMPLQRIKNLADSVNYLEDSIANVKSKDLLEVLQRSAGAGQLAKLTEQQLGALGATLLSVGTNTEVAGSSINSFIGSLSAVQVQSEPFKKTMQLIGFDLKKFADLAAKDGQQAIMQLLTRLSQLDDVSRNNGIANLFGKGEDAQAIAKLVLNLDKYKDTVNKTADATNYFGSVQKSFEKDQQKFSTQWITLKNSLSNIGTTIISTVEPALALLLKGINSLVQGISNFVKQHPAISATLATLIGFSAAAGSIGLVKNAFIALNGVSLLGIIGQISGVSVAIGILRGALTLLASHPAFIILTATTAIGYGIYKGVQNIKEIQDKLDKEDKNKSFINNRTNYMIAGGERFQRQDKSKYGAEENRLYNNREKITPAELTAEDKRKNSQLQSQANSTQMQLADMRKPKDHIAGFAEDDNKKGGANSNNKDKSSEKTDIVKKYEEELKAKKDAVRQMNLENNTFYEYNKAQEASFWRYKLQIAKEGTANHKFTAKELAEISEKASQAEIDFRQEAFNNEIQTLQDGLDNFKNNYAEREKIAQEIYNRIEKKYGNESQEAKQAKKNVDKEQNSKNKQDEQGEEITSDIKKSKSIFDIEKLEQEAQQALELEKITQQQLLVLQQQFLAKRNQIELQALEEKQAILAKDPDHNPNEFKKLNAEKLKLEQKYLKDKSELNLKQRLEEQKISKKFQDALQQSTANSIKGLITLQMSWRDSIRNILSSMYNALADHISQTMAQHLIGFIFTSNLKRQEIMANAASAASGAYNAVVGIPVVGPILAPVAAGVAYAGTIAFGNKIPSAKGGFDIPAGINPLTQLHEKEMVLPAKQANVIREMADNKMSLGFLQNFKNGFNIKPELRGLLEYSTRQSNMKFNSETQQQNNIASKPPVINYHDNSGRLSPQDIRRNVGIIAKALFEYGKGKK